MIARENHPSLNANADLDAARTKSGMFAGGCDLDANPNCTEGQVAIPKQRKGAQGE
jgi:hypothetical protein